MPVVLESICVSYTRRAAAGGFGKLVRYPLPYRMEVVCCKLNGLESGTVASRNTLGTGRNEPSEPGVDARRASSTTKRS